LKPSHLIKSQALNFGGLPVTTSTSAFVPKELKKGVKLNVPNRVANYFEGGVCREARV
jgi:hypothetical protein